MIGKYQTIPPKKKHRYSSWYVHHSQSWVVYYCYIHTFECIECLVNGENRSYVP